MQYVLGIAEHLGLKQEECKMYTLFSTVTSLCVYSVIGYKNQLHKCTINSEWYLYVYLNKIICNRK